MLSSNIIASGKHERAIEHYDVFYGHISRDSVQVPRVDFWKSWKVFVNLYNNQTYNRIIFTTQDLDLMVYNCSKLTLCLDLTLKTGG